jgi:4a-hydroxytetrahydrobiopterin dehydratase
MSARYERLDEKRLEEEIKKLNGWGVKEGRLSKSFKFANFVKAFGFMTQVAIEAEKMDHHPDWTNVYNQVEINLVTHDAKAITTNDLKLANIIESVFKNT